MREIRMSGVTRGEVIGGGRPSPTLLANMYLPFPQFVGGFTVFTLQSTRKRDRIRLMRRMFRPHLDGFAILVLERIDSGIARISRRIRWNEFHRITSSATGGGGGWWHSSCFMPRCRPVSTLPT